MRLRPRNSVIILGLSLKKRRIRSSLPESSLSVGLMQFGKVETGDTVFVKEGEKKTKAVVVEIVDKITHIYAAGQFGKKVRLISERGREIVSYESELSYE